MQTAAFDRLLDQAAATGIPSVPPTGDPNVVAEVVVEGRIDPFGDVDCFTLELVAGNWYEFELVVRETLGLDSQVQTYAYADASGLMPGAGYWWGLGGVDLLRESVSESHAFQAYTSGPVVLKVAAQSTNNAVGYSYELRLAQVVDPWHRPSQAWWPAWNETLDVDAPLLPLDQWLDGQLGADAGGRRDTDVYRLEREDGQRLMVYLEVDDAAGSDTYLEVYAADHAASGALHNASSVGVNEGSQQSWILEPNGVGVSTLTLFRISTNGSGGEPVHYRLRVQEAVADDFPSHAPGTLQEGLPQALRVEPQDIDVFGLEAKAGELWLVKSWPAQDTRAGFNVTSESSDELLRLDEGYSFTSGAMWQLVQTLVDTRLEVRMYGHVGSDTALLANDASATHTLIAQRVPLNEQDTQPRLWPAGESMAGQVSPLMGQDIVLVELQAHQRYALEVQGGAVTLALVTADSLAERASVGLGIHFYDALKWMHHTPTTGAQQRPSYISVEASGWYALAISPADRGEPFQLVPYRLNLTPVPMDDHGDTTATATQAQEWQTHFARLQPSDVDVFAMDLQAGQRYAARLVGDADWGHVWGNLLDADGHQADVCTNVGSSWIDQPFVVPTSGRYYLRLEADIDATVTFAYLPVEDDDHGDGWFNATPLHLPTPSLAQTPDDAQASQFTVGLMGLVDAAGAPTPDGAGP